MKEKSNKKKKEKKHKSRDKDKKAKKKERKHHTSSSSDNNSSEEWVEKEIPQKTKVERDDWMSMTGMLKTYTKEDIKPKHEDRGKQHIDSYNPATCARELNPYWKNGGTGLPQTPESFRKSRPFIKPTDEDDYYPKSRDSRKSDSHQRDLQSQSSSSFTSTSIEHDRLKYDHNNKSCNWKKEQDTTFIKHVSEHPKIIKEPDLSMSLQKSRDSKYLSDEKMNKLAAKIVKAEIMGDMKLVNELKSKLEAAREYRKQNPNENEEENEGVMLTVTSKTGNSIPLMNPDKGDPRSKGGKRKAETHVSGQRAKYFGNDDKYDLAQMFQQEKYNANNDDEAELARIASKHKNPNDDLADIFIDEISKNRNAAKDAEIEKQKAIQQHKKIEKSLEGCEYCVDSRNMLKHLMVSCGTKVYIAIPARTSLVKDQCIITTIQHSTCATAVDEDVWEEILNYRKAITNYFNSQDKDVVFYETATKLHRYPHMVINCVPMPRDVGDVASIYFKKAILECEAEWSMNKKVVELKGKNIRKGVPKGLPYFWIDFGMEPGFAHVIEDQQLFPKTFAEEVIAGILDLDHKLWKNPKREYGDFQRKKVLDFIKEWKPFDPVSSKDL